VISSDHSVPAMVVVVMIIVSVLAYPEHALDAANYATGHPADSTADDPADRSGRIIASAGSLPRTLSDALSLRRKRHCKKSYHASSHHRARFQDTFLSGLLFPRFWHCPSSLPRQDVIESCRKRCTTFSQSWHRAPHCSFKFRACFRGQSAIISAEHSNSFASMP
jgi:hypothetical protein